MLKSKYLLKNGKAVTNFLKGFCEMTDQCSGGQSSFLKDAYCIELN